MKHEVTIVARGEMSLPQTDMVVRYLGRQGLSARLISPEQPEQGLPLGNARIGDFQDFAATNERYRDANSKLGTRTFMAMWRVSLEAERYSDGWQQQFKGLVTDRELDLEMAARLIEDNQLRLPNFGDKSQQFVSDFIDARRRSLAAELLEE